MRFFDLHCDTIAKIDDRAIDFCDTRKLHVHMAGLAESETLVQVFACCVIGAENGQSAFEKCSSYINGIKTLVGDYPDRLGIALDCAALESIIQNKDRTAIIIAMEGAAPLQGRATRLNHFYAQGLRLLTIAWDDNEFCGSVFGEKTGLTRDGEKLIELCEDLGVIVDVSHASDQAFYDIAEVSRRPFLASHSNARAVCPNDRNLTDDMIRKLSQRGGIVGLTYGSGFICPDYWAHEKVTRNLIISGLRDQTLSIKKAHELHRERMAHLEDAAMPLLMDHVEHILNVGGADCLALGSDFDGVDSLVKSISGVQDMERLTDAMQKRRVPSRVIEKICFDNAFRFFRDVMG